MTSLTDGPEMRIEAIADFYQLSYRDLLSLILMPPGQMRKDACRRIGINPYIFRAMIDYTRYNEAKAIEAELKRLCREVRGLKVLDFGCLVADYGLYFARRGAQVSLFDNFEAVRFALSRFTREQLQASDLSMSDSIRTVFEGHSLMIFGEVLEHLESPYSYLCECIATRPDYIFSSCYPYGTQAYFELPGHTQTAYEQQDRCRTLLEEHHDTIRVTRSGRLWIRRNPD